MRMKVRSRICLILVVMIFSAHGAYAQSTYPSDVGSLSRGAQAGGVTIAISPEHPTPGSFVHLLAASFSADLDRSDIVWLANNKAMAQGPGLKEADVVAGPLGSATDITVIANGQNGNVASGEVHIRPTELDLLWESDSYVHPFYRGRTVPSAGTSLRLQAIPRFKLPGGQQMPERDLIFTWRRNGSVVQSASGRGRSSAILPSPVLFGTDTITVNAESLDGSLSGEASVQIPSTEPILELYMDHPLLGVMYHQALLPQTSIADSEMTFVAVPYFAQIQNPDDPRLAYVWRVNGNDIETDLTRPSELTINADKSNGLALIELALGHTGNLLMRSGGKWGVLFSSGGGNADPFGAATQ